MVAKKKDSGKSADKKEDKTVLTQLTLPISTVSRIVKSSLPNNAKLAKEASEALSECAVEFISFITSEASDVARGLGHRTIGEVELIKAAKNLGFNLFVPLMEALHKKASEKGKDKSKGKSKAGKKKDKKEKKDKSKKENKEKKKNKKKRKLEFDEPKEKKKQKT